MKLNLKKVSALAVFAAAAFTAQAQTASLFDLVVGFKQTGASNDVMVDFGNVSNYTAPGTYSLGNYASILSTNFGGAGWSSSSSLNWGAAASFKDPNDSGLVTQNWVTSKWTSASGTLGVANSTAWTAKSQSGQNNANTAIGKAYNGLATYSVGVAEQIATGAANSWKTATTTSASAFNVYTASQFNNTMANIANGSYSASDLYLVGSTDAPGTTSQFIGTFALFQNGDLTFTVASPIPEPSTYAAILGVATLGFAAIRRRKQQVEAQV